MNFSDDYDTKDLVAEGYNSVLFPEFEKDTKRLLFGVFSFLKLLSSLFNRPTMLLLLFAIVTNSIHLIVLLRKALRNNAINVILTSIAINDIFLSVNLLLANSTNLRGFENSGSNQNDMKGSSLYIFHILLGTTLKRNTAMFPILMATTRALVIRNFDNTRFTFLTTGRFGLIFILILVTINVSFELTVFFIVTSSSGARSSSEFISVSSDFIKVHDTIVMLFTNIVPGICYPILTIILIRGLRQAKKQTLSNFGEQNRNFRATKMIITMTILFMIAEIPQAFGVVVTIFSGTNQGIFFVGFFIINTFSFLTVLNSNSHCFICYLMSSRYKEEFNKVFGSGEQINMNETNPVSILTKNHVPES